MFFKPKKTNNANDIFLSAGGNAINKNKLQNNYRYGFDIDDAGISHGGKENVAFKKNIKTKTVITLGIIIGFALFALTTRTFYIQIVRGGIYYKHATENSTRAIKIQPQRGIIYARNDEPLVTNVPDYALVINAEKLINDSERLRIIVEKISYLIKTAPTEILDNIQKFKNYSKYNLPIKNNLSHDEALRLRVELADIPEASIVVSSRREYQNTKDVPSLSHILGYVGSLNDSELAKNLAYSPLDTIGKTGIELSYETLLRGKTGIREIQIDALGNEKASLVLQESEMGEDIKLSIDLELQKASERALRNNLLIRGKNRGALIAMNPKNGEILSLISLPSYDSNEFSGGISKDLYSKLINNPNQPLFPRAISGTYPSGSTIKPMLVAAALAENIISKTTTVLSMGGIYYDRWFFPDWKVGGHGRVDMFRAIAESVNTFFYMIGGGYKDFKGLGPEKMAIHLARFGLGKALGIDLPGEALGLVPTPDWKTKARNEEWYIGDTYHMAIGQGDVLTTPLQIAASTAAIANGGILYKPHLKIGEIKILENNVENSEYLVWVREAMRQTVTGGSARSLGDLVYGVAGKTGTAEWRKGRSPHAWFTGFAPWNDPQIVVTVLIEEGGEGSAAAVPVAKEIFQYFFANYESGIKD